jgi:hypothetical protein
MTLSIKSRLVALVLAPVLSLAGFVQPAYAHNCTGSGTITIKYDGKYYWYIQNGKVCGRYGST